jgi:5'-nucleotidase (lipoprotein e(P4) family)
MVRRLVVATIVAVICSARLSAQQASPSRELGIKYMRDSEEYATLARQVYRMAGNAVTRWATEAGPRPWAVVLDIDETTLDNSTYQLERAAYGGPSFEPVSWSAWIQRREAPAVPGVVGFIDLVRKAGGHIAYISDRDAILVEATRANLRTVGLWNDDDRLCMQINPQHTKAQRRHEVVTGAGECAWSGRATHTVVFVGDQMVDFPAEAEQIPETGSEDSFGRTCFVLPNSMYGGWTRAVTRR